MEFDIRTLSVISTMGCLVFAFAAFTVARLHPAEASLRPWATGALLAALATLLLGLRNTVPDWLSIVVANAMLVLAAGFIYQGVRALLGHGAAPAWPWVASALVLPPLAWFTYAQPSVPARIAAVSAVMLPTFLACAWAFWRNDRVRPHARLRLLHRLTVLVFLLGALTYGARLGPAWITLTSGDYTSTSSALQAAPYLWGILFNVWMSIMVTITVSVRLHDALASARDRAEAASVAKSRFLATMSHEIRTPMNGILGMAQLLQQPGMAEAERRASAQTILQSGQTLMTLLNDILDLSKVEAGKFELAPAPFEAPQLAREIETLFAESARTKGLALSSHWLGAAGAPARYVGDATRLRQMLSNLVGNAIKFTPRGSVRIEARELENDGASALLEFAVVDTGVGLPADKLALVFQAFSQADSSVTREYGGTGLGLSIVQNLARLMHGDAGADSRPGEGSRFWFRVRADLAGGAPEPAAAPAAPQADEQPAAAPRGGRVLVVEDNPVNRTVITAMLRKIGQDFLLADDGQQGIAAWQSEPDIALVLMDVQMPVMDGYAATRRIRTLEAELGRAHTPVIALTANAYAEDRAQSMAAGMDDFLAKPVNFQALQQALARWLAPK